MIMKEKVLEAFTKLGFKFDKLENVGYGFYYEGINFLFIPNENDNTFLTISVPGVYDLDEDNPVAFFDLMNKINTNLKYIKAYEMNKSVWLFYERELFEDEDLETVISRIILHLESAFMFSLNILESIKSDDEENEEKDIIVEQDEKE